MEKKSLFLARPSKWNQILLTIFTSMIYPKRKMNSSNKIQSQIPILHRHDSLPQGHRLHALQRLPPHLALPPPELHTGTTLKAILDSENHILR